jgi:hypothetical protein
VPRRSTAFRTAALTALALSLALPAFASAASTKPTVVTGAAANITPATASVLGKVTPNGAETTYLFRYGLTTLYGAETAPLNAGSGTAAQTVLAALTNLAPATTYHYRLVAHNRNGTVTGADRVFKTKAQPLGLTLAATPNPVPFGAGTTLVGTLSGTGAPGRQVILQQNPFPYTSGFATLGNPQVTGADGSFAFPLLSVPLNTQYRVLIPTKPEVVSPLLLVSVAVRVSTHVSATRVRPGQLVRFSGTLRPARVGALVAIQKLNSKRNWVTVAGTITHRLSSSSSRYSKRIRIRRGGTYRVYIAAADGNYVPNTGRSVRIRRRF